MHHRTILRRTVFYPNIKLSVQICIDKGQTLHNLRVNMFRGRRDIHATEHAVASLPTRGYGQLQHLW